MTGRTEARDVQHDLRSVTSGHAVFRGVCNIVPDLEKSTIDTRRISQPPKFLGDSKEVDTWLRKLEYKLRNTNFRTHQDSIFYVHNFLEGAAGKMTAHRCPTDFTDSTNVYLTGDDLTNHLRMRYSNGNTETEYLDEMDRLKQAQDERFMDFFARYEALQGLAPYSTESAEIQRLERKLNLSYSRNLINAPPFPSYDQLVQYLTRLDVNLERFKENKKFDEGRDSHTSSSSKRRTGDSSTTSGKSVASLTAATIRTTTTTSRQGLPEKYRNLPKLSEADRERLRREGRCFGCRDTGHESHEKDKCPLRNPTLLAELSVAATSVELPTESNTRPELPGPDAPGNGNATL